VLGFGEPAPARVLAPPHQHCCAIWLWPQFSKQKENILGEEDVFFWLGVCFANQTFEQDDEECDIEEIKRL